MADSKIIKVSKIISGGQTGADMAGILAARELGLEVDGYAPFGYLTENGPTPSLAEFGIKEDVKVKSGSQWRHRDIRNINLADGLVAFRYSVPLTGRGTECTCNCMAFGNHEPGDTKHPAIVDGVQNFHEGCVIVFWDLSAENMESHVTALRNFLVENKITKLMVSGPCQSTFLTRVDVESLVKSFVVKALGV
jgi:hypothetical protein